MFPNNNRRIQANADQRQADTSVMGLTGLVGRQCLYTASIGISVECNILNVKSAYGSIRVEISPLAGSGSAWVMLDSVRMTENL